MVMMVMVMVVVVVVAVVMNVDNGTWQAKVSLHNATTTTNTTNITTDMPMTTLICDMGAS